MSDLDTDMWDRDYPTEKELEGLDKRAAQDMYEEDDYEDDYDIEDIVEDVSDDLHEEQSLMNNARIRLEQGRLYEMLIKHKLFDGVDAMPEAVAKVEQELKEYIMERLEILLGMRAEKEKEVHRIVSESQFNDMEVEALKMIASKVTKGASENVAPTNKAKSELNTVKPKSEPTINALGKSQQKKRKTKTKQEREKPERRIKKEMKDVGTNNMSLDDIAKRDIKYMESLKNMSLSEANKVVSERHNRPRSKKTINQEAVNAQYRTRMATNDVANTFTALLSMAKKK